MDLVLCPANNSAKPVKLGKDGIGGGGPHGRPRVLIVRRDELIDLAFQVRHRVAGATADGALGE
jgi:hypothetical protein